MRILKNLLKYTKLLMRSFDILAIFISYTISFLLINDSLYGFNLDYLWNSIIAIFIYMCCFNIFNIYNNMTKFENGKDYLMYMIIVIICTILSCLAGIVLIGTTSFKINILAGMAIAMTIISYRVVIRICLTYLDGFKIESGIKKENTIVKNLLIIGAGCGARDIIKAIKATMRNEYNIVGIVDDDITKQNYNISGIYILGDRSNILEISEKYKIDVIFYTINKIDSANKKEILDICQETGAKIRLLPSTEFAIKGKNSFENLRDIEIEDLLYREQISLDNANIANMIENNVILVTGGGRFYRFRTLQTDS